MEHNPKETLADIARPKAVNSRGRKRSKNVLVVTPVLAAPLDEERIKVVERLFENAKHNIAKLEEEKILLKPVKEEIITPKVKIEDGKVVIDRDSMINACSQQKVDTKNLVKVQESGLRSKSLKRKHNERWNEEETQLFYTALQLFGTDFELISNFMRGRNRSQIKSKFKKESKLNSIRIDHAIWNRIPLSKEAYQEYIDKFKEFPGDKPE